MYIREVLNRGHHTSLLRSGYTTTLYINAQHTMFNIHMTFSPQFTNIEDLLILYIHYLHVLSKTPPTVVCIGRVRLVGYHATLQICYKY